MDPKTFSKEETYHGIIPSTNYLDTKNIGMNSVKTLERIDEIIEINHSKQLMRNKIPPRDSYDVILELL